MRLHARLIDWLIYSDSIQIRFVDNSRDQSSPVYFARDFFFDYLSISPLKFAFMNKLNIDQVEIEWYINGDAKATKMVALC